MNRFLTLCLGLGLCVCAISGCGGSFFGNTSGNNVTLKSIAVTPGSNSIALGTTQQFVAKGTFSDNSTQDLTSSVTWSAANGSGAATISNASGSYGMATGTGVGTATVVASLNGVTSNTVTLTVTSAVLTSIAVTPASQTIQQGGTQQFAATGTYSDHTTQSITNSVTWSVKNGSGSATISSGGLVTGAGAGVVTVIATDPATTISGSAAAVITAVVNNVTLSSVTVMPGSASLALGATQQFVATGTFSDGSTQNLTSAATWSVTEGSGTAIISNASGSYGLATGTGVGTATITASLDGVTSNAVTLTVSPAALVSIAVSPASQAINVGSTQQFAATGTYSDHTTQLITSLVKWSVVDSSGTATISTGGLMTGGGAGAVTVTATDPSTGISGSVPVLITAAALQSITISPAIAPVARGATVQYSATGNYSDGSHLDLTSVVVWAATPGTGAATISSMTGSYGLATGTTVGTVSIAASYGGINSNIAMLTVGAPVLVSISVTPASQTISQGDTLQFIAMGTYSDGTTQDLTGSVTWSVPNNSSTATISAGGLLTGQGTGVVTVTATDPVTTSVTAIKGSTSLVVTAAALQSIAINPTAASVANGATQQFTATGSYSDGSQLDLTSIVAWAAAPGTGTATISGAPGSYGLATGTAVGTVSITAGYSGITSNAATLTVTSAVLVSIAVTPASQTINQGDTLQFAATGTYSDHTTQSITNSVVWSEANGSGSATISAGGLLSGQGTGVVTVTATDPTTGINGSTPAVITAAVLQSIIVSPATASIAKGYAEQYTATGNYSDGSHLDLTSIVTWAAAPGTGAATISGAPGSYGLATSTAVGTVSITAGYGGVASNTATLTVTTAALTSIAVTASSTTVPVGAGLQLTAIGTFSDHTTAPISAVWSVASNIGAYTITQSGPFTVTAVFATVGPETLSAQDPTTGESSSTTVTVTAIPASFMIVSQSNLTTGDATSGFTLNGFLAQNFFVALLDANGNVVSGPNGPTISVNGGGWTVNGPSDAQSGTFSITPQLTDGLSATIEVSANYTDSTCAQPGAVCSSKFAVKSGLPTLFVVNCGVGCGNSGPDNVQVYLPPYNGAPAATITTGINGPWALAVDQNENLFVSNTGNTSITIYAPPYTGAPTIINTSKLGPFVTGLQFDSHDDLFASDEEGAVYELAPPYTGSPIAILSSSTKPIASAYLDTHDNLFVDENSGLAEFSPPNYSSQVAQVNLPGPAANIKVDQNDVLYFTLSVADSAGISAPPYSRFLVTDTNGPYDIAFDQEGHEFAADSDGTIREWNQNDNQIGSIIQGATAYTSENFFTSQLITTDQANDLFSANNGNGTVTIYVPPYTGAPITVSNGITHPVAVLLGP